MATEKIKYELMVRPNGYGFGYDYHLLLQSGTRSKVFYRGQDAKVMSRLLGIDMRDAVPYFQKKARTKNFERIKPYIARAIIRQVCGCEEDAPITQKMLRDMMGQVQWAFAVE